MAPGCAKWHGVPVTLPAPVLLADRVHHELLEQIPFSRYLNPENEAEARLAFKRGMSAPPFVYRPLEGADELLRRLDAVQPPDDTPAGALVGRCMEDTRLLLGALRDRSAEAFDRLAVAAGWHPTDADLAHVFAEGPPETERADLRAWDLIVALQAALDERGLVGWRVESDPVMSARVLVDSAKRLLRVHPGARFRNRDLRRLVVHEIDVHAMRGHNGEGQSLRCFSTGLPGSLVTEEGLALLAEERAGVSSPSVLPRQQLVARAIRVATQVGFRELHDWICAQGHPDMAWGVSLRVKRGLADPGKPGVYAKDSVYLRGRMAVADWLAAGGSMAQLYVGKVGHQDPVARWIDEGWVAPRPVPAVWGGAGPSLQST